MRSKRPAAINIGVEIDRKVLIATVSSIVNCGDAPATPGRIVNNGDVGRYRHFWRWDPAIIVKSDEGAAAFLFASHDALNFLESFPFKGDEFVYLDPPYLMTTRSNQRPLYGHEFGEHQQHERLLDIALTMHCHVAISGYWSELYDCILRDWRTSSFDSVTRSGNVAKEWLWMNYPEPTTLHDYTYLGDNFRERQRIKRKAERWLNRFRSLPDLERKAILSRLARADLIAINDDVGQ